MVIVGGDFSQQEPRLLAHFSKDPDLIGAYNNNQDLYATAAAKIYKKTYWECMEHYQDGTPNPVGKALRGNMKKLILGRQNVMPLYKEIYIANDVNLDYKRVSINLIYRLTRKS